MPASLELRRKPEPARRRCLPVEELHDQGSRPVKSRAARVRAESCRARSRASRNCRKRRRDPAGSVTRVACARRGAGAAAPVRPRSWLTLVVLIRAILPSCLFGGGGGPAPSYSGIVLGPCSGCRSIYVETEFNIATHANAQPPGRLDQVAAALSAVRCLRVESIGLSQSSGISAPDLMGAGYDRQFAETQYF